MTSTLPQIKALNMLVSIEGELGAGVTSKDIVLHICRVIGTAGGTGATIDFAGSAIRSLSMIQSHGVLLARWLAGPRSMCVRVRQRGSVGTTERKGEREEARASGWALSGTPHAARDCPVACDPAVALGSS